MACKTVAVNLLLLVCMKLIVQLANIEYSGFDKDEFALINDTCTLLNSTQPNKGSFIGLLTKGHVLRCSLSIVGGLLGRVLEYRSILFFGGAIMSVGVCLITVVTQFGLVCTPALYYLAWIPYPLYNGLLLPTMFYSLISWSSGPKSRMLLAVLYYLVTELPPILESSSASLSGIQLYAYRQHSAVVSATGVSLCLLFMALSLGLEAEPSRRQFEQLTVRRLMRYARIFAAFIVFVAQMNDGHVSNYRIEIRHLAPISNRTEAKPSWEQWAWDVNFTRHANTAGILAAACALVAMAASPHIRFMSHKMRLKLGVALAAAASLGCLAAYLVLGCSAGSWGPVAAFSVFGNAAFFDGVSEMLSIVALYELADAISFSQNKLLLFGISFTASALSGLFRYCVGLAVHRIASGGATGEGTVLQVTRLDHVIDFGLSISCLAYAHWLAFPLASTLEQPDPWGLADQQEPLIPSGQGELSGSVQQEEVTPGSFQEPSSDEPIDSDNLHRSSR